MPERRRVRLDDDDTTAAAQILSWVARPHRPDSGLTLLLPSEKKPGRVKSQIPAFLKDLMRGFEAGRLFDAKVLAVDPDWESKTLFPPKHSTTRKMAKRAASRHFFEEDNAIKRVWSKRKNIAHLASAVRTTLLVKSLVDDLPLDPRSFVADPDWVQQAIELAEETLRAANEAGAFRSSDFVHFHRDTF